MTFNFFIFEKFGDIRGWPIYRVYRTEHVVTCRTCIVVNVATFKIYSFVSSGDEQCAHNQKT